MTGPAKALLTFLVLLFLTGNAAAQDERKILARGAESYGPVTPVRTVKLRDLPQLRQWQPGDAIKEVPRRFFPLPEGKRLKPREGQRDFLIDWQLARSPGRAPSIENYVNIDGQGFTGASPPDTVGDVGPNHYVQAVNASRIAVYDKTGTMLPGYPIDLDSLAPSGVCSNGSGDPIVLYDWLADRWLLQEFTGGGTLCIYVSTTSDPTGTYNMYSFTPPSFPDYPHYGVWADAYYAASNEAGAGGNQTTYAFDRVAMLAGGAATMQRLTVVPPLAGYGFQTLTPADHDGDTPPPAGAPGIFMRHNDDEAHSGAPDPATDLLEMWEMDVDFVTPANTTVTSLPGILITDFNSWMVNYTTFNSVPQPGSATLLDAVREPIMQRLVYRNFGIHETLLGVFATNRDPATSGSVVEQGLRWFELRRSGGAWVLYDQGTFGGDSNSTTANFFVGSVAMDRYGNIALGYSKTDVGSTPIFPSLGFTGRLEGDPAGTMGPENIAVVGGAASSSGRWGDYASMSVDPADDCTFWYTGEYIPSGSGTWGTRINSFSFEECNFGFDISPAPTKLDVCAPTEPDPTFSIGVTSIGGWSFNVDLSSSGEPPGTSATFVPDTQLPDFTSTYTLLGTDGSTTGTYLIDILGTGDDVPQSVRNTKILLNLAVANPGSPTLNMPADGTVRARMTPTFTWNASSDATAYALEIATDAGFTNVVYSVTGLTDPSHALPSMLEADTSYHWRVTASNVCGSFTSATFSFTTAELVCEIFSSSDVPIAIPEGGGTSGTTLSTLTVAAIGGTIADVNVLDLMGTHTYMGDLAFSVGSPGATSVQIRNIACGPGSNFDINYDDEAAPGLPTCPPNDGGTYQPENPLAAFNGETSTATGDWTLTIVDNFLNDSGQLDSWGLEICTICEENVVISNRAIDGHELHVACDAITVGSAVTLENAGVLILDAPVVIFENGVTINGELIVR